MYCKVREYALKHRMFSEKDRVIAGVSGGADSICLLFMLMELKKEIGFSVVAVHVHHGLRGESADRDEAFVREICQKHNIELQIFHEDVKAYAKTYNFTEEEAGREVRRKVFSKVQEEQGGTKIALAHHKNDNVETFIWNLCRGTGLKGLGGILPVTGVYVRPLLCLSRKEIETYLEEIGISYCTDETNMEDTYTRNRIRNHVIPYLQENINVQTPEHIADVIENLRRFNEYVEAEVGKFKKNVITREEGKWILNKSEYNQIPDVFKKNLLYEFLGEAAGMKKDIESVHIDMMAELLDKQTGRRYDLPYDLEAIRTYDGICLVKKTLNREEDVKPDVRIRVFERTREMVTFPENPYTKWFDYDIIKCTVEIRHREPGDYIVIDKTGKRQKIKQYFVNEKVPQDKRNRIWLVADGKEIMWITGYRQNQAYQITEHTQRIMEISFAGEDIVIS